jgi:hypothetical protein
VTVRRRIDDSASAVKNQAKLDMNHYSNKTTLTSLKRITSHEEEIEKTVVEYVSDLPLDQHPTIRSPRTSARA